GSNTSTWAAVSDILAEEVNLQQDLDGDGHVGTPPITPPTSIAGMQIEYTTIGGITTSVPYQEFYGNDGILDYGFSNSILASGPYSYSNGVISVPAYSMETRLTFNGESSGTYESYDIYGEGDLELVDSGTFAVVTPSLEVKTDWQRTETFDSPLSNDYWQVWRRSIDSLAYDGGKLSFIYGSSPQDDSYLTPDTEIPYARKLPMDKDWQVVLDDIYAATSLVNFFNVGLELKIPSLNFECELSFQNGGEPNGTREFQAAIDQQLSGSSYGYAVAYVTANEDPRISSGGDMRIIHVASSHDLICEYQPYGASDWTELARINLTTGAYQGQYNGNESSFAGGLVSATDHRMTVEIEALASVATQVGDLEIGGIEIGAYTPTDPTDPTDPTLPPTPSLAVVESYGNTEL
ncbi:MAG: hypothetical protein VX033_03605, partial [Verrucomicrobiota bacterium]|nr:hypothetical protein [Verrucomicrobiota bacterium]